MQIEIDSPEEKELIKQLEERTGSEAKRLLRFLDMPDLSRTPGSPIYEIIQRVLKVPRFADFDVIKVPEILPYDISFDLFNFPPDHSARSKSDTYFTDEKHVLRIHTTVMWYYWLNQPEVRNKIEKGESIGALSYGKVYRRDEIDRNHMPVFHQIDGWWLVPKFQKVIGINDLKEVLTEIVRAVYGEDVQFRFNSSEFPFTDPSIEIEVNIGERWLEVVGAGIVRPIVLKNLGVDSGKYNGWAFGFGIERLAMASMDLPDIRLFWSEDERIKKQLKLGQKFVPVSKYLPITRDISFIVGSDFILNSYFDLIRDLGGDLIEEVQLIDKYEDSEKFGSGKISYTYRIIYRSNERTLVSGEIDSIQAKIYEETAKQFGAELR